jgi:hypothetical protein
MPVENLKLRDHESIIIEEFNGLWDRGGDEACPMDHFLQADNIQYIEAGFKTRDGIDTLIPGVGEIVRMYTYQMQDGESLLVLDNSGNLYHVLLDGSETVYGPILSIVDMDDFGFTPWAGRAFITPFENYLDADGRTFQRGLEDEFLYVYKGDGTTARKAAGPPPTGSAMVVAQSGSAGNQELGFHLFAVVYETDTGYLTAPGPGSFTGFTVVSNVNQIAVSNIPIGPSYVTKRHLLATKAIINYNGDQDGYQLFFIPEGNIDDNTSTTKTVQFYDIDLLADASHLIDNYEEIPAGVNLARYRSRLVLSSTFDDESLSLVSWPGEPEAISQVEGLVIIPLDGIPITNAKEFRDVLYYFKYTRTYAVTDNGDVPSSWRVVNIDQGIGAPVHGVAEVLDSAGVNVDMLLIGDYSGIMVFSGHYSRPELSFKIQDFWLGLTRDLFYRIEILNDTISERIYIILPDRTMLMGDYSRGLNPMQIKWAKWSADIEISTIAIIETNTLAIGSEQ